MIGIGGAQCSGPLKNGAFIGAQVRPGYGNFVRVSWQALYHCGTVRIYQMGERMHNMA
jgi:hypothetical protein